MLLVFSLVFCVGKVCLKTTFSDPGFIMIASLTASQPSLPRTRLSPESFFLKNPILVFQEVFFFLGEVCERKTLSDPIEGFIFRVI